MRIISGKWRRRRLRAPSGRTTRPMLDRVREALFNVIAHRVPGARTWDLFAGTGSLGLEALSRGAASCLFVERDPAALALLQANLDACRLGGEPEPARIVRGDGWEPPAPLGEEPDLVFLDPPYAQVRDGASTLGERLRRLAGCLAPEGLLLFHYDALEPPAEETLAGLTAPVRTWGTSSVALIASGGKENR